MTVDETGVDKIGVDKTGVDELGINCTVIGSVFQLITKTVQWLSLLQYYSAITEYIGTSRN